jgi:hypothetical protein
MPKQNGQCGSDPYVLVYDYTFDIDGALKNKKMMSAETIIRAADCLPEAKIESDPGTYEMPQSDALLFALFGDTPVYSRPEFENIWQMVIDADDKDIIAYCLEKGIDVLDKAGKPVPGFRDIAVMLTAIEKGHIKLNIDGQKG